jgi:hypothetical protein
MAKSRFARLFRYFLENWNRICLLVGSFGTISLFVLSSLFPAIQNIHEITTAFIYFTGGAVVFILLEIHRELKQEEDEETEINFAAARTRMIADIVGETRQTRNNPLVIRIIGMRLTAVQQLLGDIAYEAQNNHFGGRPISIKVYHVNPQFLAEQKPVGEHKGQAPAHLRFEQQVAVLMGNIGWIQAMYSKIPNITIEIANYRNTPLFWAVDVGTRTLFWGFFMWDKKMQDWVGPENRCMIYRSISRRHELVLAGLLDRIDSLTDWAEPTLSEEWFTRHSEPSST